MHLWVVQPTISWSCLLHETIQSMTSYAQTLTLVLKHTGVNHTGSQTRIRFTFDLELSFFEASVQFLFEEFKQPQHKCLLYQRFGHAVIQALSIFGFGFCAFLFDLVLLFWILCCLGSSFCAKSNLWFGCVIFICFFVVLSVLILYFLLFLWHKIQWRYISINRIYLMYFFKVILLEILSFL